MHEASLVLLFTDRLGAAGIEYMVTGSVACIVYGEPRLTHDVDLVIALPDAAAVAAIATAFPLDAFYTPPIEIMCAEQARHLRGHFNIIHHDSGYKADVYLLGRDTLHAWAFARRRRIAVGTSELSVAPPEYVIVRKLEFFREGGSTKHLDDIVGVLAVSGDALDYGEIERLANERGLEAQWSQVRQNR